MTTHSLWCETLRLEEITLSRACVRVSIVFPKRQPGNYRRLDRSEFISAPSGGALDDHKRLRSKNCVTSSFASLETLP